MRRLPQRNTLKIKQLIMRHLGRMGGGKSLGCFSRVLVALVFFLFSGLSVSASAVAESLQFRIIFPVNSADIQTELFDNSSTLSDFTCALNELRQDENVSGILLSIRGNASVEGNTYKNKLLAAKRAEALSAFVVSSCSIDKSLIKVLPEQPLSVETDALLSEFPDALPGIDLPSIRRISGTANGLNLKQAFRKLDGHSEGANWVWFKKNILEPSRFAEIRVTFNRTVPEQEAVAVVPVPAPAVAVDTVQAQEVEAVTAEPETEPETEPEPLKREFRIGTNLLYDVATVANLHFEYGFCRHLAVNVMATYSPWDIKRPDIKIRTLLVQPEVRWYLADNFKGHYFGVEGHYGWYNVALGGKTRYQDRDGNTPLWGAGISYGYVLPFSEHWGMDFGISAGYANLIYDCFYNVENGAKYTTQTKGWWGPTRVGISIYYQF